MICKIEIIVRKIFKTPENPFSFEYIYVVEVEAKDDELYMLP